MVSLQRVFLITLQSYYLQLFLAKHRRAHRGT